MASQLSQQQVAIEDLSLEQLAQVKRQLDDEIDHLTLSYSTLKQAELRFKACKDAIGAIRQQNKDKEILVPLTPSLYVSGVLTDFDNVIVDVGTGYYVAKSTKDAQTRYNMKIITLRKNLDELESMVERKEDNRKIVMGLFQKRLGGLERDAAKGNL